MISEEKAAVVTTFQCEIKCNTEICLLGYCLGIKAPSTSIQQYFLSSVYKPSYCEHLRMQQCKILVPALQSCVGLQWPLASKGRDVQVTFVEPGSLLTIYGHKGNTPFICHYLTAGKDSVSL